MHFERRVVHRSKLIVGFFILLLSSSMAISNEVSWRRPGCYKTGYTRPIRVNGCVEFKVTTNACRGFCESLSLPSVVLSNNKRHPITSRGQCCNIMDHENVTVKASCVNEGERSFTFRSAKSCACYHCMKD